ncbi:MAG: DnaJ domain-containing protein [Proteobacteria bacterium]|nr:DnaJ domain-containing protein [Pseudomonadota bacterium]
MAAYHETLNLAPEATADEIKRAYRRLAKQLHPDVSGQGDASGFMALQQAYQALMRQHGQENGAPPRRTARQEKRPAQPTRGLDWRFEGVASEGSDVVYVLRLSPEAARRGLKLDLPWKKEDACPSCLGLGHTLVPMFGGEHLSKAPCLKCQTSGVVGLNTTVQVELAPEAVGRGQVRLTGRGHYRPAEARRGDLVVEILVEEARGRRSAGLWAA